jgi:RNA polymerase primary sigma factor
MNAISDIYFRDISKIPLLTRDQERVLSKDIMGKNETKAQKAINTLVVSNLRLAAKIAEENKFFNDRDDLMSEATLGLYQAAKKYDARQGAKFSSYAAHWVRQYIRKYVRENVAIIPLTNHTRAKIYKIQEIMDNMREELGREPMIEEVAEATGVDAEKIEKALNYRLSFIPLDSPAYKDAEGDCTLSDIIADPNAIMPDDATQSDMDKHQANDLLDCLNEREKEILSKRYGFYNQDATTLEEIGKQLKVSRERIRQLQDNALKKLKKKLVREDKVRDCSFASA